MKRDLTITQLPTELKLHILGFVDRITLRQTVPLINTEFRSLSTDYSLYRRYETDYFHRDDFVTRTQLSWDLYRKYLRVLVIDSCHLYSIKHLRFPRLEHLIFKGGRENESCKNIVLKVAPNLTRIDIVDQASFKFIEGPLLPLVASIERLKIDRLEDLSLLGKTTVKHIVISCHKLSVNEVMGARYRPGVGDLLKIFKVGCGT